MARERTGRRQKAAPLNPTITPDAFTQADPISPRPAFSFLSEDNLERIKSRAFDLLEQHGIAVVHEQAHPALSSSRPLILGRS